MDYDLGFEVTRKTGSKDKTLISQCFAYGTCNKISINMVLLSPRPTNYRVLSKSNRISIADYGLVVWRSPGEQSC